MINFLEYIKKLFPSFTKHQVLESAELTKTSIVKNTLPAYKTASDLWKDSKFKSKDAQFFAKEILSATKGKEVFAEIYKCLENSVQLLDFVSDYGKKVFSDTEANRGLTYAKATMVRYVQASEFANNYARKLLNYIYAAEAAELLGETDTLPPPTEIKKLKESLLDFTVALKAMKTSASDFEKHLKGLPDAIISELSEHSFQASLGDGKLDPMALRNFSPTVSWNPFYLIGMQVAEYQAWRYKSTQDEITLIQMRLIQLEKLRENGQGDAGLEKEIGYYQDRLSSINFKMHEMERKYGV